MLKAVLTFLTYLTEKCILGLVNHEFSLTFELMRYSVSCFITSESASVNTLLATFIVMIYLYYRVHISFPFS